MAGGIEQSKLFLKCQEIAGESKNEKYSGSVELISYSIGSSNYSGGMSSDPVSVSAYVSKASPVIMEACASGGHIPKLSIIELRGTESGDLAKYKWTFSDVFITNFNFGAYGGDDQLPVDSFSFQYAKKEQVTTKIVDGKSAGETTTGWDYLKGSKL